MRVLLSTIGSRGDVAPMVALASYVRELGHEVLLCAPPTFAELIAEQGMPFLAVGHDVREGPRYVPGGATSTVTAQFDTLLEPARRCDVIVGCAAMQIAARSIAQKYSIPYFYVAYAPVTLPSPHHPPLAIPGQESVPPDADIAARWALNAQHVNATWGEGLNAQRAQLGLDPVTDVHGYLFTDHPMLAADPILAPWPTPAHLDVLQTGAWLVDDRRALPADLEAFLDAGDPPVYFGFGSIMAPRATGSELVDAARTLGYRAVLLRGWAGLTSANRTDCFVVDEVNQQALFPRTAAVVHHGGSGTTTVAMRAGTPQVILPHTYDQHYFACRVVELGIGTTHVDTAPTVDSLAQALGAALTPAVAARARELAPAVRSDGTAVAAQAILA